MAADLTRGCEFVTFQLILPLRFNAQPGEQDGRDIPPEILDDVDDKLQGAWGPFSAWDGYGRSVRIDGRRCREPQRYYLVDVPRGRAAAAWDWFGDRCAEWARRFGQDEVYLRVPAQGLTFRFRPAGTPRPAYNNPFPRPA
jgi:hypothetical protein